MVAPIKNKIPKSVLFRIKILLSIVLLISLTWELSNSLNLTPMQGKVINVKKVFAGRSGDSREFTIEYFIDTNKHILITRRGIFDALGSFCCLNVGDNVAIAVNKDNPRKTILDSFNARYPLTISFFSVIVVMFLGLWFFIKIKKN